MKTTLSIFALCAVVALAQAQQNKDDPRFKYSTEGWTQVWSEEFDVDGLPNRDVWKPEVGFIRNHEPQYYTDMREENCFVKDGTLTLRALREKFPNPTYKDRRLGGWSRQIEFAKYTSADIVTKRSFLYGRLEVRAKTPSTMGAWPAIWMLGDAIRKPRDSEEYWNWPACGEIDILEIWCSSSNRVTSAIHTSHDGKERVRGAHKVIGGGDRHFNKPGEEPWNGFHTYTLDWYEDCLVMFYDGKKYGYCDLSRGNWPEGGNPFHKPMFLLLNLALGGYGNPVYDEPTPQMRDKKDADGNVLKDENGKPIQEPTGKIFPATEFPIEYKIDYVRYFEKK